MRISLLDLNCSPSALIACAVLQATSLGAQGLADPGSLPSLILRPTPLLEQEVVGSRSALPTFVSGERLFGHPDLDTVVEGKAMLRRGDLVIKAERLD